MAVQQSTFEEIIESERDLALFLASRINHQAVTMESIRPAVRRHGLATDQEIDAIIADMHAFAENPATLVGMPRMVQVWATI